MLRILNPSEKGAENSSSQAPTVVARRFYLAQPALPWVYIFVTSDVLANVLMYISSQAAVDIYHAALSLPPRPLRLRPRFSIPSFPMVPLLSP
jgi:hypothetical protein